MVAIPRVGKESDDWIGDLTTGRNAERGYHGRSRRPADEQPFFALQAPGHGEALLVGNAVCFVDDGRIENLGWPAAADTFDLILAVGAELAGLDQVCEAGADWFGHNDANPRQSRF